MKGNIMSEFGYELYQEVYGLLDKLTGMSEILYKNTS
jgi:hypothetical protein